jgi:hypothetical protein
MVEQQAPWIPAEANQNEVLLGTFCGGREESAGFKLRLW